MFTVAVTLLLAVLPLSANADPLWDKAVAAIDGNSGFTAGALSFSVDEFDGRGSLKSNQYVRIAVAPGEDGKPVSTILYAEKDGKDVTEERRANPQSGQSGPFLSAGDQDAASSAFSSLFVTPFDIKEQNAVVIRRTGETRTIGGREAVGFTFEHRTSDKYTNTGTAWLDRSTGTPLETEVSVSPLPAFVQSISVRTTYGLAVGRSGSESLLPALLNMDGEIRILFYYRKYVATIRFSEYFQ